MNLRYEVIREETIKGILKSKLNISKRLIKKLKDNNKIIKNGKSAFVNEIAKSGDIVEVNIDFEESSENIVATEIPLDIIYEDSAYIILNKPAKIETHPTCANYSNTLANGLKYYFEKKNIHRKIRPVNRLDKDTSGLIIFAKNEFIQDQLICQMKNDVFKKEYIAIVEGKVENDAGIIDAPIKRKEQSIIERCVSPDGEIAITEYEVIRRLEDKTIIKCMLKTGRTHQIRVHMNYIKHPIIGDFLYGQKSDLIDRQALHSYKLQFLHPINKQIVNYEINLPEDMKRLFEFSH